MEIARNEIFKSSPGAVHEDQEMEEQPTALAMEDQQMVDDSQPEADAEANDEADTDRLAKELPQLLSHAIPDFQGGDVRRDPTLRHYGVKADVHKEGEGGHYWVIAGGDVVLFASSQVPAASDGSVACSPVRCSRTKSLGSSSQP